VRNRARAQGVTLYTISFDTPENLRTRNYVPLDPAQLILVGRQTGGLYFNHVDDASCHVLALFERLTNQRKQYLLTFDTPPRRASINSRSAPRWTASAHRRRRVHLETGDRIALVAPASGLVITQSSAFSVSWPITLNVEIQFPDDFSRDPTSIEYLVNDELVATRTAAPFSAVWNVAGVPTGTYSIQARLVDSLLTRSEPVLSNEAFLQVVPEPPKPPDRTQLALAWLRANWVTVLCIPGLTILAVAAVVMRRRVMALFRRRRA
jgi:hypothetical protein